MRFCVFSDLHYDAIPDGDRRIRELLKSCRENRAEFIVELGDLCHNEEKNRHVVDAFRESGIPCYFSLGNHNLDGCGKEAATEFLGLERPYYVVKKENVKFIFLDANEEALMDGKPGPYIPLEQITWLEEELSEDGFYFVICSHQSLVNDFVTKTKHRGVVNREEVRTVLEQRRDKILFCINGHEHGSGIQKVGGIYYYQLNSASYYWQNVKEIFPYGQAVHEKYPYLKNMVQYREPLHVMVTIDEKMNVEISGMEGHYLTVGPEEIGMGDTWNGVSILPRTETLHLKRTGAGAP